MVYLRQAQYRLYIATAYVLSLWYTVSQKRPTILFVHNFGKCWPIFRPTCLIVLCVFAYAMLIYDNWAEYRLTDGKLAYGVMGVYPRIHPAFLLTVWIIPFQWMILRVEKKNIVTNFDDCITIRLSHSLWTHLVNSWSVTPVLVTSCVLSHRCSRYRLGS